jgi:lysozyme
MTPDSLPALLERDEARVPHAYQDSLGFWTIGVGHLIDERKGGKLPNAIIDALLDCDVREKTADLHRALPWAAGLDAARHAVLVSMCFQLGVSGLLGFPRAIAAMRDGRWNDAADHFLDSRVAREQSPARWQRHARMIRTGEWV